VILCHQQVTDDPRSGLPPDYGVILRPIKALVETSGYVSGGARVHVLDRARVQFQDLDALEAARLGEKPSEQWRNGVAVSRIEVKVPGADEHVVWVGSLKNGDPAGLERAPCRVQ
jgi:hypothetical protein